MTKTELMLKIKEAMLAEMYLNELTLEDLQDDLLLFGNEGLQLDSLDAVELVVLVEKHFGVSIDNAEHAKAAFISISCLADYILEQRKLNV